jgi:hypothetical protein
MGKAVLFLRGINTIVAFGWGPGVKSNALGGGTAKAVPPGLKPRKARVFRHTPPATLSVKVEKTGGNNDKKTIYSKQVKRDDRGAPLSGLQKLSCSFYLMRALRPPAEGVCLETRFGGFNQGQLQFKL